MSTIVALATPPGIGALHVIRMSGDRAFDIINQISTDKVEVTSDRLQLTFIKSRNGQLIDQVVISKYKAPRSYTGEDCIEISCHGNGLISKLIIDELIKHGAVYAERGEFTKRAFLNNKIDLNQAINIGSLFSATNEIDIYSSVQEIRGANSKLINKYLSDLLNLISECELNIDYPREIEKEDSDFLDLIRSKITNIHKELVVLLDKSKKQKLSGYRVVFIGKPNAGKSSLVNYLIGQDKIIVSDKEGTTQDAIEVEFCFEGYLLTLVDTAGINSEEDFLKYEAAKKSKYEIGGSDLLIHLISCDEPNIDEDFWKTQINKKPYIKIFTKSDLNKNPNITESISVKNKDISVLLDYLRQYLKNFYTVVGIKSWFGINNLSSACEELSRSLSMNLTIDLIVEHLHNAYDYLSSIIKANKNSFDKINSMFDSFCIGK